MLAKIKSGRIESQRETADCPDYKEEKLRINRQGTQNEIADGVVPITFNCAIFLLFVILALIAGTRRALEAAVDPHANFAKKPIGSLHI